MELEPIPMLLFPVIPAERPHIVLTPIPMFSFPDNSPELRLNT